MVAVVCSFFNRFLTSSVAAVTVTKSETSKTFYFHTNLLFAESEREFKSLGGEFKEAKEKASGLEEDPELFGFFVEYLYRDRSILSRDVQHYAEYVTLARLYALGDRLMAPRFKACALWRFSKSLGKDQKAISDEAICKLLHIACTEITERTKEDPMRAHIFWYAATQINKLQQSAQFRKLLCDIPESARQLCLWVGQTRPPIPSMPNELQSQQFAPESEYAV
jgi:hypothetical protein